MSYLPKGEAGGSLENREPTGLEGDWHPRRYLGLSDLID